MNVLIINAGSSSLKYQLMHVEDRNVLAKGICERIGEKESFHKHGLGESHIDNVYLADHNDAMKVVLEVLTSGEDKAVDSLDEIDAIGHRIVQGGKYFDKSCIVTDEVIAKIDELAELAPLHNKAAIMGINACLNTMPGKPMVTVFDTSYFVNLPERAYMYPLPYEMYTKHAIRKYGAHGTSHRYLSERAAAMLGKPESETRVITCHLGNGASITASAGGHALDTSMGLTPLDGVMMGSRCGSIDPAVVPFVMEREGIAVDEISNWMNKKCGLLGVSGVSNDMRAVTEAAEGENERAKLALDMYGYILQRFLGQYFAVLGGDVDAIVISAGIGENNPPTRTAMFEGLEAMGLKIDEVKNQERRSDEREISAADSKIKIFVIPTEEEYMIARDTYELVNPLS